jgi:hypothetical protein
LHNVAISHGYFDGMPHLPAGHYLRFYLRDPREIL